MNENKRILVLFAHPALQKSKVNRELIRVPKALPFVTFHDLYEEYPDFQIDVPQEQELLTQHDIIVFQHPFYWYSCPALLKEWIDLVLTYGFAFGSHGVALKDKYWLQVVTTGGSEHTYRSDGMNRFTMAELLAPFNQTAHLCHMQYLAPFVFHGTHRHYTTEDIAPFVAAFESLLIGLGNGDLIEGLKTAETANDLLNRSTAGEA